MKSGFLTGIVLMLLGFLCWFWFLAGIHHMSKAQWAAAVFLLYLFTGPGVQVIVDTVYDPKNRRS